jgi:hypothetical protein
MNNTPARFKTLVCIILMLISVFAALSKEPVKKLPLRKPVNPPTPLERTDAMYDSLKAKAGRNWFLKNFSPAIFSVDSIEVTVHAEDKSYERWRGKTIRYINIKCMDVFPPDSTDAQRKLVAFVKNAGNKVHIKTREWIIRSNLLFHEGDKLEPKVLRRNIAYLRDLKYLSEARFFVVSTKKNSDSVDVLIVTQDKFSINVNGDFASFSHLSLRIDDKNFLGLGNQLNNEWSIDPIRQHSIGWESYYSIPNIYRTFIKGELNWSDLPGYTHKSAILNRPFLFPARYAAGGAEISETYVRAPFDTTKVDKIKLGAWSGYCLKGNDGPANQYIYSALSVQQTWYKQRPDVGLGYGRLWHESLLVLGSLAITQSEYKRLPYMYSFLENEDIPVGFVYEYLMGKEFGEFRNREFLGLHGSRGFTFDNSSFLYLKSGIETFLSRTGLEQGIFVFEPLFITPVTTIGKAHSRTFIRQRIILSNKRFVGESLKLSTDNYFRGDRNLSGDNIIAMGIEKDIVAPGDLLGFNFIFFGFADGAVVTDYLPGMNKNDLVVTEGLGIRLRNPYLIWKSLEFHVALNHHKGNYSAFSFALVTKVPLKMIDFEGRKPEPYSFK